ncbi:RNA polymerase sigma factor [Pelagicoccus mobilis]|uniref:RNA polymerase sigma factor n=1 Tax=Pelagicoccus mobilis TaxID=415221 RepID=A0A934VRQ1_9BACT|nr:RNA polymerase sigma factor [Pelagicoccus mobilis]MBK1877714.1 RNA polymerase sigma factor [Pelagicoccus mobilis]
MGSSDENNTRYTLLHRALDMKDDKAWAELVTHYRRFILYVLGELQVNASDREDLCQQVLISLMEDLPNYDRERGRFRSWLSGVIRNKAVMFFRSQSRYQKRLENARQKALLEGDEHSSDVDEYIEQEWVAYIGTQAMERVRDAFEGRAVEVFEMGLDGVSAGDIAEKTGLTISTVYSLRKRVKKRLSEEIYELKAELEP